MHNTVGGAGAVSFARLRRLWVGRRGAEASCVSDALRPAASCRVGIPILPQRGVDDPHAVPCRRHPRRDDDALAGGGCLGAAGHRALPGQRSPLRSGRRPAGNGPVPWRRRRSDGCVEPRLPVTTPQRDYLFRIHQSQGYGRVSLEPVAHPGRVPGYRYRPLPQPEGTEPLYFNAFTRGLRTIEEPPRVGRPAPDLIFVPDLGSRLWYDPASLTDLPGAERDPIPTAMFRRVACGPGRDPQ